MVKGLFLRNIGLFFTAREKVLNNFKNIISNKKFRSGIRTGIRTATKT